jgi:hypothetical protein
MADTPESDLPHLTNLVLLNLIRLLAAELVAGEHRHDVDRLLRAIESKVGETPLPRGVDVVDARAAFAEAKRLLAPIAAQLKAQAAAAHISDAAEKGPAASKRLQ